MLRDLIDFKKIRLALWYMGYGVLILFLQDTVFARFGLFGVKMFFAPAACVAVGGLEEGYRGGLFGLWTGILCDMIFPEHVVLFTLLFPALGFFAGMAGEFWLSRTFSAYLAAAAAAIALTGLFQAAPAVLAQPGSILYCLLMVVAQTLWSMPMAAAVYFPARAIARRQTSR